MFEPHGRFVRVGPLDRVEVGTWRAVDARTVEIKFLAQQFFVPQLFDPGYAPAPLPITNKYEIWTLLATVDEGANTLTLGGGWDVYQGGDKLFSAVYGGGRAVRMALDPAVDTPVSGA